MGVKGWGAWLPFVQPLVLLAIGVALLFIARRTRRVARPQPKPQQPGPAPAAWPADYIAAANDLASTIRPVLARDALARAAHRLADASHGAGAEAVGRWARALEHAAPTADAEILGDLFEALEEERRSVGSRG
jgi:hypothetical protein